MEQIRTTASVLLRWTARLLSIASIGLLCAFAFGGEETIGGMTAREATGFEFFPIGVVAGMAAGWWRERWGGWITVLSLAGFYVWQAATTGKLPLGPFFLIFALPGILFLITSYAERRALPTIE